MKGKHGITALHQAETEHRHNAEEWLESHSLLDAIQRLAKIGGWEWDLAQHTMTWTDETYRIHGMTPGELAAGSPEHIERSLACYDPEDRLVIAVAFQRCMDEGQPYDLEFPFTSHNGRRLWIRTVARPLIKSGRVIKVVGNIIDITEYKETEEALRLTQERLALAVDGAELGLYDANFQTGQVEVNETYLRMLGFAPGELTITVQDWLDSIYPDDRPRVLQISEVCRKSQRERFEAEYRVRHRSGEWIWVLDRGRGFDRDENGQPRRSAGIRIDITERKQVEQRLQLTQFSTDEAALGIFWIDTEDRFLYANAQACRLLGYSLAELQTMRVWDIDPEFPESMSKPFWQDIRQTRFAHFESTHRRKDGSTFPVELSIRYVEYQGQEYNFVFAQDITKRKRAEMALRGSEQQYRAAVETSLDGFWMTDRQGRLLEINDAYTRLSGYTREELLSLRITDLEAQETPEQTAAHIEMTIQNGSDLFRTWHRAKSGRIWQAEISTAYWPIAGGRFFAFIRDIYRRQRSEALLKARLELSEKATVASLDEILRAALDLAERFTSSPVSFFHFVDADQEHLTMQTWSTNTLKHLCTFPGKGLHYPLSEAGVWADGLRQHQPVVYNDYASLPHRQDLPTGHAPIIRVLTVPIQRGKREVAVIGVGNKPEDYTGDDIASVQELTHLLMDIIERKQAEERIAHLAYHDVLTELPNRALLTDRLRQAIAQTQRDQRRLAMCFLDLDDFKLINDAWGHAEGDRVLVQVAQRLKECVRAGDTVARLGGDEFVLLLANLSDVEECEHTLDRIQRVLQAPLTVAGQSVSLNASIGVTLYPDDSVDPDALLRHVDQAMYAAKQSGGNCYRWFDAELDRRAREYRAILQRVEAGLAAGEFRLYYQPKVEMRTGAVFSAEALIRWQHPDEGLLPPARFMPEVENSELAIVLDRWVLGEALRQMSAWAQQGLALPVSVNLSGRCLQQPNFAMQLQMLLATYPATPMNGLLIEILETAALEDIQTVSKLIVDCQLLGVRFALDDFGTGYSSLTYLKHLPVQMLKIDQSFVRDALVDGEARAIVEGVIGLSKAFRRTVIAEGVETVAHGCLLLGLGCDLAQGYGIARPMPPERIPAWIADWTPPDAWTDEAGPD